MLFNPFRKNISNSFIAYYKQLKVFWTNTAKNNPDIQEAADFPAVYSNNAFANQDISELQSLTQDNARLPAVIQATK